MLLITEDGKEGFLSQDELQKMQFSRAKKGIFVANEVSTQKQLFQLNQINLNSCFYLQKPSFFDEGFCRLIAYLSLNF